jgi:hypothetical protein
LRTINGLDVEQLSSVAQKLGVSPRKSTVEDSEASSKSLLAHNIKSTLIAFYNAQSEQGFHESYEILALWRDYTFEIIDKKKVKVKNQDLKDGILKELKGLSSRDILNDSDQIVSIVRDILALLWQESSEKEKRRFTDIINEDLEEHNQKFTEKQLNQSMIYLLMGGAGGAVPVALPLVSGIMLQQLTKVFIIRAMVLGAVTGPIGWGISMGAGGLSMVLATLKFKKTREKLRFIQAILSMYSYRYQNQLKTRRQEI